MASPHFSRNAFYLLFIASGFAGLIYESVWTHYLKLYLGHAAYAQSLVLIVFMGGMALGAALCARVSTRIRNPLAAYAAESRHARLVGADARHDESVGGSGSTRIGGHFDRGAHPFQGALGRPEVARAVVEDNQGLLGHKVPLVDGTPVTRGSGSTAWRSARATALYCASVMWCGSLPYSVRTCNAMRPFIASDSKTCRLMTVWYGTSLPAIVLCSM